MRMGANPVRSYVRVGVGVGVGTAVGAGIIRLVSGAQATVRVQMTASKNHGLDILIPLYCGVTCLLRVGGAGQPANNGARILPEAHSVLAFVCNRCDACRRYNGGGE